MRNVKWKYVQAIRFLHCEIPKHFTKHDRFKCHQNRAVLVHLISGSDSLFTFFMSLSVSHLKCYDKLTQQEVIANVVRHATISFPEHTRKRACSGNKIGHMPLKFVLILAGHGYI